MTDNLVRFYADHPDDLLDTQRHVVAVILARFAEIVRANIQHLSRSTPIGSGAVSANVNVLRIDEDFLAPRTNEWNNIDFERPHQVFTVDGARGSGKTYVLLTLAKAIKTLSDAWREQPQPAGNLAEAWQREASRRLKLSPMFPFTPSANFHELAMIVRVIIPSDMERQEGIMERIFDFMNRKIEATLNWLKSNRLDANRQHMRLLVELRNELRESIVPGWHFARETGREIVIRDAVDYNDYIERFGNEAHKAVEKIDLWRRFLARFLDFFGVISMVVLLDDSDVQPWIITDVLHTARMYLNHPRIVTVIAGNIRSMRDILVQNAMEDLSRTMGALSDRGGRTAADWRRIHRRAIEDFLEKVLPLSQRLFIGQASSTDRTDDFKKITKKYTLSELCRRMISELRGPFLRHKFRLATLKAADLSDRPEFARKSSTHPDEMEYVRRSLEDYLSWWLFWNWYKDALAPRSARQIATFRDYYKDDNSKRLIIALYENPANFTVIQQLRDADVNVHRWLQDQQLDSEWVGPRCFHINGRLLDHGQFAYDYIRYRLDLGIASPTRLNAEEAVPLNLLPVPRGRTHIRRFFQPNQIQRRQRRLGVCRWIDHAAIPANCIYFRDLDALPDRSLLKGKTSELRQRRTGSSPSREVTTPGEYAASRDADSNTYVGFGQGHWEAWLAENWMDLIDDEQDEDTYRYFTGIVCASQRSMAGVKTSELLSLLDGPSMIREHHLEGSYEDFVRLELQRFISAEEFATLSSDPPDPDNQPKPREEEFGYWSWDQDIGDKFGVNRYDWLRRMISRARYAALISDVRRAWHAIRIFDLAIGPLGRAVSLAAAGEGQDDERAAFAVLATQDRLKLYRAEDIRKVFESVPWCREVLEAFNPAPDRSTFLSTLRELLGEALPGDFFDTTERLNNSAGWGELNRRARNIRVLRTGEAEDIRWTIRELCGVGGLFDYTYHDGLKPEEEGDDYTRWVRTLRAVGRFCVADWPDLGVANPSERDPLAGTQPITLIHAAFTKGRRYFEERVLSPPQSPAGSERFGPLSAFEPNRSKSEDIDAKNEMIGSPIRNFVFLLYGLSPSLSALLHSELMGIIWQWQDNYFDPAGEQPAANRARRNADLVEVATRIERELREHGDNLPEAERTRLRDEAKAVVFEVRRLEAAIGAGDRIREKMRDWANLIASLAMALRYIRAKYLQLHFLLWLEGIQEIVPPGNDNDPKVKAFWSETRSHFPGLQELLSRLFNLKPRYMGNPQMVDSELGGDIILQIITNLRGRFKLGDSNGNKANRGLSLMSDAASSSVFGDRWLEDTIVSLHRSEALSERIEIDEENFRKSLPSPGTIKADGIFAETEQWLWAANRCLRKFRVEFHDRWHSYDCLSKQGLDHDSITRLRKTLESFAAETT